MAEELTAYLAAEGFEKELQEELSRPLKSGSVRIKSVHGRLLLTEGAAQSIAWAQNTWKAAQLIPITSISDGARKLRELGPRWSLHSISNHRRASLIQEQLPKIKSAPLDFLGTLPGGNLGSWTLLENNLLLASSECSSLFADGEIHFNEDRKIPPSRAYLKLWELFTAHGVRPPAGAKVMDLGSCPGGWTWVLQQVGCHVLSVDKAPLDPKIAKLPRVESVKKDAFQLKPQEIGPVDWLFSDIICEPRRLFELVSTWRESGLCSNFVCTIKFKGQTDHNTAEQFAKIPGSRLFHQFHNKHELTWVSLADPK